MRARLWYGLVAFAIASVLNPGYFVGCAVSTDDAPKFQYGSAEMTEFALAANDSYEFDYNSEDYRLDLDVEPERADPQHAQAEPARGDSPFAISVHACGDRQLFSTASACLDSSSMNVSGKFTLTRVSNGTEEIVARDVPVQGMLFVGSLTLVGGQLSLQYDGGSLSFNGTYGESYNLAAYQITALLDIQR